MDDTLKYWSHGPNGPELRKDQVHVWGAYLDQPNSRLKGLMELLSTDEHKRANRFHFDRDREQWIVSRGILRLILSRYLKKDPSALKIIYNTYGKPHLAKCSSTKWLHFNLTHSRGIALYAMACERDIGIDLELIRPGPLEDGTADRNFTPGEVAKLHQISAGNKSRAFFNCWTRKEAFIKAKGQGLSIHLDQFEVTFIPSETPRLVSTSWDPSEVDRWSLIDIEVDPQYACALAVEGHSWFLNCWKFAF